MHYLNTSIAHFDAHKCRQLSRLFILLIVFFIPLSCFATLPPFCDEPFTPDLTIPPGASNIDYSRADFVNKKILFEGTFVIRNWSDGAADQNTFRMENCDVRFSLLSNSRLEYVDNMNIELVGNRMADCREDPNLAWGGILPISWP